MYVVNTRLGNCVISIMIVVVVMGIVIVPDGTMPFIVVGEGIIVMVMAIMKVR